MFISACLAFLPAYGSDNFSPRKGGKVVTSSKRLVIQPQKNVFDKSRGGRVKAEACIKNIFSVRRFKKFWVFFGRV